MVENTNKHYVCGCGCVGVVYLVVENGEGQDGDAEDGDERVHDLPEQVHVQPACVCCVLRAGTERAEGLWVNRSSRGCDMTGHATPARHAPHAVTHPCAQPMLLELLATSNGTARTQASATRRPITCSDS